MKSNQLLQNQRLKVSDNPPYDALGAFVRDNHIALHGSSSGPLSDLVFAVKDVFMVKGSTFGNGHPDWLRTHEPDKYTASSIITLLDHGADLVGKTVCDELCFSISGENWNYGSPLNPHDVRRFTGGSSSGSAAATAGGFIDFSTGSDCLGSVRVPAAYNGLFGMRPTYKRVKNDGEAPYCESMDVLGYVASSPEVFSRVSNVLLGPDAIETTLDNLYIPLDCFEGLDEQVIKAMNSVISTLSTMVKTTTEFNVAEEGLEKWMDTFRIIQGYEVWESYGGWIHQVRPKLSRGPKERLAWASTIARHQYLTEVEHRRRTIEQFQQRFPFNGVMILPTTSSVAPLRTESLERINAHRAKSTQLLCVSPLTNTPQITLPLLEIDGVPFGVTLISREGTDSALVELGLSLAKTFKQHTT